MLINAPFFLRGDLSFSHYLHIWTTGRSDELERILHTAFNPEIKANVIGYYIMILLSNIGICFSWCPFKFFTRGEEWALGVIWNQNNHHDYDC